MDFRAMRNYRNKVIDVIIILSAVIISYNIYAVQGKSIASLKQLKETEIKKNEILAEIVGIGKKIDSYKAFVNKKDLSTIINKINNIAGGLGGTINSIKPLEKREYDFYTLYPFSLIVTADSYNSAVEVIKVLENSEDVYTVEKAVIKPVVNENDPLSEKNVQLELLISTVFLK